MMYLYCYLEQLTRSDDDAQLREEYQHSESSGHYSVPNSEPVSDAELQEEEDELQPLPPRTDREYQSPSPELEVTDRGSASRRIIRYEEYHRSRPTVHRTEAQGHKRTLSDATKEAAEQPPKKKNTDQRGGRAKRGDFQTDVQEVIKIAQALMRIRLYTIDAFPTVAQLEAWINEAWKEANEREGTDYEKSVEIHKMVPISFLPRIAVLTS